MPTPAKVDCSKLAMAIYRLAMNVAAGLKVRDIDSVVAAIQKDIPEIRRADIVSAINEALDSRSVSKSEAVKAMDAVRREARTDRELRKQAQDFKNFIEADAAATRKPKPPDRTPEAIAALKARRDAFKKVIDANRVEDRVKIQKRIDEINKHIADGTVPAKTPREPAASDLQALRDKRDALRVEMKRADPSIRAKLKDQIAELQGHIDKGTLPASPAPKRAAPADVAALRKQRNELTAKLRRSDPARIAKMEAKVAELESHLSAGTLPAKSARTSGVEPERLTELQTQTKALRAALAKSEPALREKFTKQIEDLTARLEETDGVMPVKKDDPRYSPEIERLAYQRDRLRGQIRQKVADMRPKSIFAKTAEPVNLARSVMTSMDVSGVLRQGGFITIGNPVRAAKSLPAMFKSFASEQKAHAIMEEIHGRDNAPLYARSKLYLGELDGPLGKQEEAFMSRLASKIPLVAGSQRAYTVFLNKLRADSFDAMAANLARNGTPTGAESRAIANYINVATGRAPLGKAEAAGQTLATVFFAPRYAISRFQLLAGQPLHGGTWKTRKLIAKEYAKYLAGMGVVYGLGKLAGGELEDDPRSSDFGKIKFGDTRLDPLSGLAQTTTLIGRLATGESKRASGKVVPIRGNVPFGSDTSADVVARFLRSKLSPAVGGLVDIASGENVVGEKVTPLGTAGRMMTPLAFRDIYDVMRSEGVPEGTALGILSLFGMGVQHYEPRAKKSPEVDLFGR